MKIYKSKLFIAFIIVMVLAIGAITYHYILHPAQLSLSGDGKGEHHGPPPGGEFRKDGEGFSNDLTTVKGWKGIMKQLGEISIIVAAVSFGWFVLKKKIGSKSKVVKTTVKTLFNVHVWTGWVVIGLALVHSVYFLLTDFSSRLTWTGISATVIMLGLLVYGYYIRRVKNKFLKAFHRWLSFAWLPVLFLHGGGIVVQMIIISALVFVVVRLVDRYVTSKKATQVA